MMPYSKIESHVENIRKQFQNGDSIRQIADKYQVPYHTIYFCVTGRTFSEHGGFIKDTTPINTNFNTTRRPKYSFKAQHIALIRTLARRGVPHTKIAEIMNASSNTIYGIATGITYRRYNNRFAPVIRKENGRTGHKGVYYRAERNDYRVRVSVNRKMIHIGYFDNIDIAAAAYQEAVKQYKAS
jgi:hypothetical protein